MRHHRRRRISPVLLQLVGCCVKRPLNEIKMFAVQHEITSDGNNHHCMRTFHFIYMLSACYRRNMHKLHSISRTRNIRLINNILSGSDVDMSYRNRLDQHSELFHHNWTRPKRSKSQVNGHTEMSQTNIILRSNAKAHRW